MKFTKEQAFEKLKGELTKGGKTLRMTDRTINAMLDTLIPLVVNDETELDKFVADTLPSFVGANGNMEHDYADFVKNYKPTPKPNQDQKTNAADDVLDELRTKLEGLEKTLREEQLQKNLDVLKVRLSDKMKDKGIKDEKWIEKYVSQIGLTEDLDVESKAASALEIYNLSQAAAKAPTPFSTKGNSSLSDDKLWDDVKQKMKQNG